MTKRWSSTRRDLLKTKREASKGERRRAIKIVREALDSGEYERSLGQAIVRRITSNAT